MELARVTTSGGKPVGDIVRFVPAPESPHAAAAIFLLTLVELTFVVLFLHALFFTGNSLPAQAAMAFWLGGATITVAAILAIYRKFFVPDVLQVKLRKLKYEDLR
ncbi:MAG TPA: hypothetical protein VI997_06460 [Candidatus Thermoplasmatota archaeon]|nr:hypothetical protein [Candidatus Thermoplasmatota archaeon]